MWSNPFTKLIRTRDTEVSTIAVLDMIKDKIVARNIPVIVDDFDTGYDMAIDEVLDIVEDARKAVLSTQKRST